MGLPLGLVVQKYGGTSVGTPERIQAVADRIARSREAGAKLVVVVSAMGHTTDELIDLAYRVSKTPPHREMDMLLTAGERISMALLSMALADRGVPAVSLTGSQTGIITTSSHRRARIIRILGDRVRRSLEDDKVVIVAGFQGVSESKEVTTLGRGGSDTSAAALAAALGADLCEIYTDVDGVYSADPRIVPEARIWPRLGYDAMVQLASLGAGVLHARSVELARQHGLRLVVRSSLTDREGTLLVSSNEMRGMEEFSVVGVTCDRGKALATVELTRATVISSIWDLAARQHLMIAAPIFADRRVSFYIEQECEPEWRKLLQGLAADGFLSSFAIDESIVPVSVVGERFSQDGEALSEIFDALSKTGISATLGQASAISATIAVPRTHADDAIRELHSRFVQTQTTQEGKK